MNFNKIWKVFTSKFVGTGPLSYKKEFTGPQSHRGWETLLYTVLSEHNVIVILRIPGTVFIESYRLHTSATFILVDGTSRFHCCVGLDF